MTEAEWLAARYSRPMINLLKDKVNERKWRLFAVACCRLVWSQIPDERSRRVVESAELFADGLIKRDALDQQYPDALAAYQDICRQRGAELELLRPMWQAAITFRRNAPAVVRWACLAAWTAADEAVKAAMAAESVANSKDLLAHCDLLREVFGNPFRPTRIDRAWITPPVLSLAQVTYEVRTLPAGTLDVERLAVLSDALEEAGCTSGDLLAHLRSDGPHARGCWAVDLILGKE
jgi:hypothetical protein